MGINEKILKLADAILILTSNDKEMIKQDLNHREAGIAFEHIVGTIYINKYGITKDIFDSIKSLSIEMGFDNDTWERLIPLVR